mgnify:CR=1 FL=1
MGEHLILLTKNYPFDHGEEFIENEITYLSGAFRKITVIATACSCSSKRTREIPANAAAYKLTDSSNRIARYVSNIIKGLFLTGRKEVKAEIRNVKGAKRKVAVLYLAARARGIFHKIIKDQKICADIMSDGSLIYCYWFLDLPLAAAYLKEAMPHPDQCAIISRAHGYDLYEERSAASFHPFRKFVFDTINCVFPCSENGTQYLKNRYPAYAEKIKTAYLGTKDCGAAEKTETHACRIVTCSGLTPIKRLHLLAEALCLIDRQFGAGISWYCIGDGPQRTELREMTADLKNVHADFLGHMDNQCVMEYYKKLSPDLFINVSSSEGLPVSVMEAISMGIPVLATDVGGTREIVIDGVTGQLLPKDITPEKLAEEIMSFMNSGKAYPEARAFWNRHFNAESNYREFAGYIATLS